MYFEISDEILTYDKKFKINKTLIYSNLHIIPLAEI